MRISPFFEIRFSRIKLGLFDQKSIGQKFLSIKRKIKCPQKIKINSQFEF